LERDAIDAIVAHPFEMAQDGVGEIAGIGFSGLTITVGEARGEEFAGGELGKVGPEIADDVGWGGLDAVYVAPVDVTGEGFAVTAASVPGLITEDEFVAEGGGVNGDVGLGESTWVGGEEEKREKGPEASWIGVQRWHYGRGISIGHGRGGRNGS